MTTTILLLLAIAIPNAVSLGLIAVLWLRMDRIERRAALEILGLYK